MKEMERLKRKADRWRTCIAEQAAARDAAEKEVAALSAERESALLAAHVENDTAAQAQLEELTPRLVAAGIHYCDLGAVMNQAEAKLREAEAAIGTAERAERRQEAEALAAELVAVASEIEPLIVAAGKHAARWREVQDALVTACLDAEIDQPAFTGRYWLERFTLLNLSERRTVENWQREAYEAHGGLSGVVRHVLGYLLPSESDTEGRKAA